MQKKYKGYKGVCVLENADNTIKALKITDVSDIWGIGRRQGKKLNAAGIYTAYDFVSMPQTWVRKKMTVMGERTWRELQGEPCIELESGRRAKKHICISRSFGKPITSLESVTEAVATFAAICAKKLRGQRSLALSVTVLLHTNPFGDGKYFSPTITYRLTVPTNYSPDIILTAKTALRKIFVKGYKYKKAGVIIGELVPDTSFQGDLFTRRNNAKETVLMNVVDSINERYGHKTVFFAQEGGKDLEWKLKQEKRSPRYTTHIGEILSVS